MALSAKTSVQLQVICQKKVQVDLRCPNSPQKRLPESKFFLFLPLGRWARRGIVVLFVRRRRLRRRMHSHGVTD